MDLNARPYRAFVRIAELGSFHRAAETLALSQPALSAQIRELERQLGFQLFHRHNRRISLTPEGALFLDRARRFVLETDWINRAAREIRENQLRIGVAHHSAGIPERCAYIEGFAAANPELPIKVISRAHSQLYTSLRAGEVDVAITLEVADQDGAASVVEGADDEFARWSLGVRRVGLALRSDHPLSGQPLTLDHLDGLSVGTIGRAHGVALSEAIARRLVALNARLVHPPEGDAASLFRYGVAMNWPVVDLTWFRPLPAAMASSTVEHFDLSASLSIVARRGANREAVERFIGFQRHRPAR